MSEVAIQAQPEINDEVIITSRAVEEVRKIKVENNIPESYALRLGVTEESFLFVRHNARFQRRPQWTRVCV